MGSSLCGVLLACFGCLAGAGDIRAQAHLPAAAFQEHLVIGTVVAVNSERCLITIRQSNLLGYLRFNLRSYAVIHGSVLAGFRPGDRIRASFSTSDGKLHRLHHIENRAVLPLETR
jgi:hypothetical protein